MALTGPHFRRHHWTGCIHFQRGTGSACQSFAAAPRSSSASAMRMRRTWPTGVRRFFANRPGRRDVQHHEPRRVGAIAPHPGLRSHCRPALGGRGSYVVLGRTSAGFRDGGASSRCLSATNTTLWKRRLPSLGKRATTTSARSSHWTRHDSSTATATPSSSPCLMP